MRIQPQLILYTMPIKMPSEKELVEDLEEMLRYYEGFIAYKEKGTKYEMIYERKEVYLDQQSIIDHVSSYIQSKGFFYEKKDLINFFLSLKTKPFVILSGISGTGKTKIVQWFAESLGATEENGQFTLIPVRPDWSDSSDLLGYVNLQGEFQERPLIKVLEAADANPNSPYFVVLDEMNLARVEYYFSDFLSVIESRKWKDGKIVTSPVLPESITNKHITIPSNVYIIGTVNMDETTHPYFQKRNGRLPTVTQKPDTMLAIEKKGKNYQYQYIFDAKYRIDFAERSHYKKKYGTPGPMEEDINTMHRYRDALVVEQDGPFERTAYGAYVLFPWNQEEAYENHPFYKSIEKVNIGGFPFLPNATRLVEQFLDHLIEKSPEEIIREGILPRGTKEEWHSSLEEKVLVGSVKTESDYETYRKNGVYQLPIKQLKPGWQEAKCIALYASKKWHGEKGGIQYVAKIKHIQMQQNDEYVYFKLEPWKKLEHLIRPVGYGIQTYTITTMSLLKEVQELPEIFMKSKEERTLWKTLRRFTKQVKVELDHRNLDEASAIKSYYVQDVQIWVDYESGVVMVVGDGRVKEVPLELVIGRGSVLFREVLEVLNVGE